MTTEQDMRASDARQNARQAALDALAASNGIQRGDNPLAEYARGYDDASHGFAPRCACGHSCESCPCDEYGETSDADYLAGYSARQSERAGK